MEIPLQEKKNYCIQIKTKFSNPYRDYIDKSLLPFKNEENIFRFSEENKWGLKNKEGVIILPAIYDYIDEFNCGIANIIKIEIKCQLTDSVEGFPMEVPDDISSILLSFEEKYGLINTKGEVILDPEYSFITPFIDGEAIASSHRDFLIDRNGEKLNFNHKIKEGRIDHFYTPYNGISANYIRRLSNGYYFLYSTWGRKDGDSERYDIINLDKKFIWSCQTYANDITEYTLGDYVDGKLKIRSNRDNSFFFIDGNGETLNSKD
ncbi:WG repeat-containing protein [Mangrovibacterium marinum]|uniref:WG repeat-containing protein n=1 Tax=Mangrovibacterium marinum TaxID=1639118 RepID=UPI002A18BD2C|nr:WG repeat-containing protein [Mangrovibacterium marinum]